MATDVEARDTGNSAMIIAIVALILIAVGAFAFFGSGNRVVETTPGSTSSTTVVTQPAAPAAPDVHVDVPPPVVVNGGSSGSSGSTAPAAPPAGSSKP